jgi:hypothetical protein
LTLPLPLRRYKVVHWDPPHKVIVTGDSSSVAAVDSIQFYEGENGTTKIEYDVRMPPGTTASLGTSVFTCAGTCPACLPAQQHPRPAADARTPSG